MKSDKYIPSGQLQGDDKGIPDRGTSTGVTDTYGADLGQNATNRIGGFRTKSDPIGQDMADPSDSKPGA